MALPALKQRGMSGSSADTNREKVTAREIFWRYHEVYDKRGHTEYVAQARRQEDYYLGGGRHWTAEDRATLEADGRPAHEVNGILTSVNAAVGFQINNRVDVGFLPRGGRGDEVIAKALGKMMKHVTDNMQYRRKETNVFLDGIIQRRGYLDLRMDYEDNVLGEIAGRVVDPLDGLPDPDAKDIDPDTWADWMETRWMTARELEGNYGRDFSEAIVANSHSYVDDENFSTDRVYRTGFDEIPPSYCKNRGWMDDEGHQRRWRVIERQINEYSHALCAIFPTGDIRIVEGLPRERLAMLIDLGAAILKRRVRRVRWQVAAPDHLVFDKVSPYEHISVVPYFPIFRRGRSIGLVDNMISPQDMLNKFLSQYAHAVNGSANAGWQAEANSFTNMSDEEFVAKGAQTGLVLLRKPGKQPAEKIKPNEAPQGLHEMVTWAHQHLIQTSGIDPSINGNPRDGMSGVAIQAEQHIAQQKLALPLDNLAHFRHMVAARCLKLIQRYMGNERVIRITEADEFGTDQHQSVAMNQVAEDGMTVLNDLTIGEYDVAVSAKPSQVTFDNTEFEQMAKMRELGIAIPDAALVKASNLADKTEIAEAMRAQGDQKDPVAEADAALKQAQAAFAKANATAKGVEAIFSAVQTGQLIASTPLSASLADKLLLSAGFVDQDASPIVPEVPAGTPVGAPPPLSSNPLTPSNPGAGMTTGLSDSPDNPPLPPPGVTP